MTAEHPAQVIVEPNPADPTRPLAALKIMRDDVNDVDVVVLFRPGYTRVARHEGSTILPKAGTRRRQAVVAERLPHGFTRPITV